MIVFRPMLISGMLGDSATGAVILIDNEQPRAEQVVALWHETLHLLGIEDEDLAEAMAKKLAAACPEILDAVPRAWCKRCPWRGAIAELLDGEACPRCSLVLCER